MSTPAVTHVVVGPTNECLHKIGCYHASFWPPGHICNPATTVRPASADDMNKVHPCEACRP